MLLGEEQMHSFSVKLLSFGSMNATRSPQIKNSYKSAGLDSLLPSVLKQLS